MEKRENIFLKKSFVAITGASRGIGRCMALKFAVKFPPNSVLVLMARNVEALESVRTELQATTPNITVLVRQYDQGKTDEGYFNGIFDSLLTEGKCSKDNFKQVMLVHNCATIGDKDKTALQLCDADRVRSYFDINLSNEFCKAARDMFFRVLSAEEPSIRVLTYAPGGVDTGMLRDLEANSSSTPFRQMLNGLRQDGQILAPEETVVNLVRVLEDNAFENADHVDNYGQTAQPYIDKFLN
ncbi:sepiapterin reductase-like [Pecten maximus]|uniref:sepiapterin reductase-like n=1 Tax=Pecten maximus TaxID=6579 RepID=UPI0014590D49|nr:sepiapterin reductase-like [Pecten maximus]